MEYNCVHNIECNSSAEIVYSIIKNSDNWPIIFEPCQSVEVIERTENSELIKITAKVNSSVTSWKSNRKFDHNIFGINSEVVQPMPMVKEMTVEWRVIPVSENYCELALFHQFNLIEKPYDAKNNIFDKEDAFNFINSAIDKNSKTELLNIKQIVERKSFLFDKKWRQADAIVVNKNAKEVFEFLKDMSLWPDIFSKCLSAKVIEKHGNIELVEVEALIGGEVSRWITEREYDEKLKLVKFNLQSLMPLVKKMFGKWIVFPKGDHSLIYVERNFELVDNIQGVVQGVDSEEEAYNYLSNLIKDNVKVELDCFKNFIETREHNYISICFSKTINVDIDYAYQFLSNLSKWQDNLPHCESLKVTYDDGRYQEFSMDIFNKELDKTESFRSVRFCSNEKKSIQYFQPCPPPIMKMHSGAWLLAECKEGVKVTSIHEIHLDEDKCLELKLGPTFKDCKRKVEELVVANSMSMISQIESKKNEK